MSSSRNQAEPNSTSGLPNARLHEPTTVMSGEECVASLTRAGCQAELEMHEHGINIGALEGSIETFRLSASSSFEARGFAWMRGIPLPHCQRAAHFA
jgi:hypothetical protein